MLPLCAAATLALLPLTACQSGSQQGSAGARQSAGTDPRSNSGNLLERIRRRGELIVLTRNAPTIYYLGRDGFSGPAHDMTTSFAHFLGVKVRYKVLDSIHQILSALQAGEGDIAAAGLTETPMRKRRFLAGPRYQQVRQQVVCRRGGVQPDDVKDLVGIRLAVVGHSSYVAKLRSLQKRLPKLSWKAVNDVDTEELLDRVWQRKIDCTIADSNIVKINRRYHPELTVAFNLTAPQPLVWYMPHGADALRKAVRKWFAGYRSSGALANMIERYYGFVRLFDYVDIRSYMRSIRRRLPQYRSMFKRAARRYQVRWTLLAAQAYQESKWNPRATSPTGVRGIMMLTRSTARQLGVTNRLHPRASILGGAKYLAELRRRLPADLHEPDRTWVALAAYNVGMGHIYDARTLARKLGKDPNSWHDLKEVLPLLSHRHYYRHLRYGYARGEESVQYVARIRNFEDILERQLKAGSAGGAGNA